MTGDEDQTDRGFTVVDRRGSGEDEPSPEPDAAAAMPRVDFSGFCLSLATSALYHLGVVGDPESGQPAPEKNMPLAQQTIDVLTMLREKTNNNLDEEEAKLLDGLLYELRMRFVEAGKTDAGPADAE